jgi:eukaryotic-like serine/threonine-protein kinase
MTADRLRQIEELFHAVREGSAGQQADLLARADPEIRREVESLLARQPGSLLLDRPVVHRDSRATGTKGGWTWSPGTVLGPYRIEGKLGAGGMGDVFRAVDTRLQRAVAIKIVHAEFGDRFGREARAISALNHPNICTLYDVGPNYLVMELVEGETLASRLKHAALPLQTALSYASQILAALSEAHGKNIVHRDLKPGNIMVAKSGIKVLDFGLAKSDQDESLTASHMVVGTPAYMAPEQRDGRPADARCDIYSFGCVLYEMVTGVRVSVTRKRIRSRKLEHIVKRCLEEDPAHRWPSVDALLRELSAVTTGLPRGARTTTAVSSRLPPAEKSTIVLADFANATSHREFDAALQQIVALQLESSSQVCLLPDARLRETLGLMGRPVHTKLTSEVAAQVCERTGSAAVTEGSITNLGTEFVMTLRATDCRTGEILHKEQVSGSRKEDVFKALAQLAKRFATRAGEMLRRGDKEPTLPADVTTRSQDAWQSYSAAMKASQTRAQSAEGISLLQRAIEIDPTFATAYANLGLNYASLGETERGVRNITKAYELRDGVSDRENYFITFSYHRQVTGNLELARQTLESWTQKYPRDVLPHGFLSGFTSPGAGRHEKAVEEGLKAIALDPDFAIGYENVAWAYVYLNRPSEAEALLRKASERRIDVIQFSLLRYALAFLERDTAAMDREAAQRPTRFHAQGWFEHQEALTSAYHGRLREAARLSSRAVTLARQGGFTERAAQFEGARAVWSALCGLRSEAQSSAAAALALSRSRDVDYGPALSLMLIGESGSACEIMAQLDRRYPDDTSVQFNYLPVLRGVEALAVGNAAQALEFAQSSAPYDLAVPRLAFFTGAFFGSLYPVYVRGLAYSRLGRPREAAGEFQKLLDQPGLVLNDPIGAMARLGKARALAEAGDRTQAAAAYEALLNLWKDADSDVPTVIQARAEYAKLT